VVQNSLPPVAHSFLTMSATISEPVAAPEHLERRTAKRRGIPNALINLALVAVSVVMSAGLAELLVRWLAPQQLVLVRPDVWQSVDTVGWRFRPSLHTTVNTGERTVHLYTDREGFRVGPEGRVEAPTRVLLIGDSYMAALQVEYAQSLAGLFEQRLPERLRRPIAIRNAGQAGWDPPQYLFEARSLFARDTFSLALVSVYIGNDVVTSRPDRIPPRLPVATYAFRLPRRVSSAEFIDAFFHPANDWLKRRSQLFIFFKSRLQPLLMRLGLTAEYFPEEFRRSTAASSRWDITCGILADLARVAAQHGVRTVFMLIPAPFQVEPEVFRRYARGFGLDSTQIDLDQPTRLMREGLEARGLTVIDVLPAFRAAERAGPALYGSVDRHLSPRGHDELERLIEPRVVELLEQHDGSR